MDVKLNFIDNSNDTNNSDIVIFQKNIASDFDDMAVAWLVIKNCGRGANHPFTFPMDMQVSASDSYGNFTPKLNAQIGQLFQMVLTSSGDELELAGCGTSRKEVQVRNSLAMGAINAYIYKAGKLLAVKNAIAPEEEAVFGFKPSIWIGVVSQIDQGQVMHSAITSNMYSEISLLGIASADIVMTGDGSSCSPFTFNLQNIVWC